MEKISVRNLLQRVAHARHFVCGEARRFVNHDPTRPFGVMLLVLSQHALDEPTTLLTTETWRPLGSRVPLEAFSPQDHAVAFVRERLRHAALQFAGLADWPEEADADVARIASEPSDSPRCSKCLVVERGGEIPCPCRIVLNGWTTCKSRRPSELGRKVEAHSLGLHSPVKRT